MELPGLYQPSPGFSRYMVFGLPVGFGDPELGSRILAIRFPVVEIGADAAKNDGQKGKFRLQRLPSDEGIE